MYDMPIIRISMEHMRHDIVHAFSRHTDEMKGKVDAAVQEAIKNFDFDREVSQIADSLIRETIRNSLKTAFTKIQWDEALTKALAEIVLKQLESRSKE